MRATKRLIEAVAHGQDRALAALDREQFLTTMGSDDFAAARAAFLQQKKAD